MTTDFNIAKQVIQDELESQINRSILPRQNWRSWRAGQRAQC
jgi:hypothetical protein